MTAPCVGPLIWFGVGEPEEDAAILECPCGYVVITSEGHNTPNDEPHALTPLIRSHA